ncbi:MAG: trypsin-like peptidase domain-containing protein [Bdellovibrionales bacterium]
MELDGSFDVGYVIYGDDDRKEFFELGSGFERSYAEASAAIFHKGFLEEEGAYFKIGRNSFQEERGVCSEEPFSQQQLGPSCSGVLIASDLVLTAGHCSPTKSICNDLLVNFDFKKKWPGQDLSRLEKTSFYQCEKVIYRQLDSNSDFAIIKLDRPVTEVLPVTSFAKSGNVLEGDKLSITGYPLGLPFKYADGGRVLKHQYQSIKASLDSYGGNSGSPVFLSNTGQLAGILVRGESDFVEKEDCKISKRCSEGSCQGEEVMLMDRILEVLRDYQDGVNIRPPNTTKLRPQIFASLSQEEIPDSDYRGLSSSIFVNAVPEGRSVVISVDIEHDWIGDLKLSVISPDGIKIVLRNKEIETTSRLTGVFGYSLVSLSSLDPLSLVSSSGTWKLEVIDSKSQDTGKLLQWKVIFK